MKRLQLALFTALLLSVGVAWADLLDDADAAYKRGDYANALKIWQPLSAQKNGRAQNGLGMMYDKGQGVTQNYAEALKWYRLAAAQGHASAQFNLGQMYRNGNGTAQNYIEALKWYRLAAVQGFTPAQLNIGVAYGRGQGVARDLIRAHMWLSIAAAAGSANAIKSRDIVAQNMSPQQVAAAEKSARECQARKLKGCD